MEFDSYGWQPLDDLGIREGTDKSSLAHGFLPHYARAFASLRAMPINVMEIGVSDGPSARMWRDYFLNGHVIGIDIQERCRESAGDRLTIEIGSQSDPQFLDEMMERHQPSIIIDDGSHLPEHVIFTFTHLFRRLPKGGCYVVEDLFLHTGQPDFGVNGDPDLISPPAYFAGLSRMLMNGQIPAGFEDPQHATIAGEIDRIEVVRGATLVWRRGPGRAHDPGWLQVLAQSRDTHYGWGHLANYLMRTQEHPALALHAAQRAVALRPDIWMYHHALGRAAEWAGDLAIARGAYQTAAGLADDAWKQQLLNDVERVG